ncbi:hypothetical protein [Oribacterium sp. NK2B42]|uniref:hypothetical protein n=1 Tax=Oribacterium sp. NK2B42 TaxID=689781 RepID=UPI0004142FBA|nr:hypothetical protein [Oribacterium sp. NK2B42]
MKENSIKDNNKIKDKMPAIKRQDKHGEATGKVMGYVLITIAVALFGAIYEYFSFGVYSYYMIYAFVIPLILGVLPWIFIASDRMGKGAAEKDFPPMYTINLWGSGIATLTVGSVFHGILDIYGTTGSLSKVYFIVGAVLLLVAVMTFIGDKEKRMADARIA